MSSSKGHRHSSSRSHKAAKSSSGGSSSRGSGHTSSKSSDSQSSVTCGVDICVQPPTVATYSTALYPSIVAKATLNGLPSDQISYLFAHAVLIDASGLVMDDQLGGTPVRTGIFMEASYTGGSGSSRGGSGSGSGSSRRQGTELYFIFPDLHVPMLGDFRIRISIYHMLVQNTTMGWANTRNISIIEESCAQQWGSQNERWILQCFRNQGGVAIPDEPQPDDQQA
ncbi:hypothetical protein QBC34DRAFT_185183 [Podospora aff. communis PSN243]|uniref:Velvet domain-containing protein n=1 Tax=Podospora aff. communis PSN243 TaxID=3040156 RepID=A0AAV9GB87_9PEZI|nr:hypothetical protein QBC34DRAFT_185183 [Podospora aff. communis PSN243]